LLGIAWALMGIPAEGIAVYEALLGLAGALMRIIVGIIKFLDIITLFLN